MESSYLSEVIDWLTFRASATCLAPSASRPLPPRLQTRIESKRHGLLTLSLVGFELQAHSKEVRAVAVGIRLLRTIAPGTPTPLLVRLSLLTLFLRSETSGMPQKSVSEADSSTTLARFSALSTVILFQPTLQKTGGGSRCHGLMTAKASTRWG